MWFNRPLDGVYNDIFVMDTPTNTFRPIRLCIIVTASVSLYGLYRKQWLYWTKQGFDVHAIADAGPEHKTVREMGVTTHSIPMVRNPSPLKDLVSLVRIWWFLLWHRFDIVHVSTPKAGFLGAIAARLSRHKRLIYTIHGRCYENMTGWRRKVISGCDWLSCHLAQCVMPVCHELGQAMVNEGLCPSHKIHVVGSGSCNGVDISQFTRTKENVANGQDIRRQFGIAEDDLVILFVGWLRREKGINELVNAFESLAKEYPKIHLLLLGNFEPSDPLEPGVVSSIKNHPRIHCLPWCWDPVPVYAAGDIFALPSYREGLPSVALEASAMELPVVATDIMGCREAVKDQVIGLLVPPADTKAIENGIKRLIEDPALRNKLGINGRDRVLREFRQEAIWAGILEQYQKLLSR